MEEIIVNPELVEHLKTDVCVVTNLKERYEYKDGRKTENVIGENIFVVFVDGPLAGQDYVIHSKKTDVKKGEIIGLNILNIKIYCQNKHGFLSNALSIDGQVRKVGK